LSGRIGLACESDAVVERPAFALDLVFLRSR
jgi:hypothetical protein